MDVRVSRLPVGSSARRIVGLGHERARDRHALLLAARQLIGEVVEPVAQADRRQRIHRALVALGRLHLVGAVVEQRQLDVVERRGPRQQVEPLEDEPDLPVADDGELVLRHARDVLAVEDVGAARRPIEAAEDVHQRGLAGT